MIQDLRYAIRALLRSPGFTLVAVATLALGIGATTTVFSVVEGVLLRALPFPDAGRLVQIMATPDSLRGPGVYGGTAPLNATERWRSLDATFDESAVYTGVSAVLRGSGPAERVSAWGVSSAFFTLLGGRPMLGRGFLSAEDRPGSPPVAVLSYGFWTRRMGSDPRIVGTTLTLDTTVVTVVGVMPAAFQYPADAQVWTNLGAVLSGPGGAARANWFVFWTLARLRPGVSAAGAERRLEIFSHRWTGDPGARGLYPIVTPLREFLTGRVRPRLVLMLSAVALVLLIACANVAGLVLSRAMGRRHLVAMRAALGAGRARLVQGSIAEPLLIALAGGVLGVLAAAWCLPAVVKLAGPEVPGITGVGVDGRVLAACLVTSVVAGLLAGAFPAWQAGRLAPAEVLKAEGNRAAVASRGRLGGALIVGQLALTMALLAGSLLLGRSFVLLTRLRPGFEPSHVLVADVQLPASTYAGAAARLAYARQALDRVGSLPGVSVAAVGTGMPLAGGALSVTTTATDTVLTWIAAVTPDYFRVLGIPLARGRALAEVDPDAIVLDSAAARASFRGEDPLGKRYVLFDKPLTVVGIVGNVRQDLAQPPLPHVYVSLASGPSDYLKIVAVTRGDPSGGVAAVRRELESLDAGVPVGKVAPLTSLMAESLARQRFYTVLLVAFGVLALLLAAVGVYGLASYAVSRRTREFGVRIALGAQRGTLLRLVMDRALALAGLGIVLGLAVALAATRTLKALLFEVGPDDPTALMGGAILLLLVTLLASWLPARRAMNADPMVALRAE